MSPAEAIAALDALDGRDIEVTHSRADDILLAVVPEPVAAAYQRATERAGAWWYA